MIRQRPDPDVLDLVEERPAGVLDRVGLAGRNELDIDGQLLGHPDEEEVRVERALRDAVQLDPVDQDRARLVAIDGKVDEGVLAGLPAQELELVGVDRHARRIETVAEDDRGQAAFAADPADGLAGDGAASGGQAESCAGHGTVKPPKGEVPRYHGLHQQPIASPTGTRCTIAAMATILIVEDEHAVARGIEYALQQEGYTVNLARSGEEGLDAAVNQAPDLVILDVRLPGIDGFEVLRRLRAAGSKAPVMMLTARDDEVDKVIGLELGADDYVTKPFGLRELLSRVKALLRRAYGDLSDAQGGRVIRHGDLIIDLERRRVQRGARRIGLTPTEFEILRHLASRPGRVYTRSELLELLRDYEALDQDEKTINVHVSHLRDKIEDDPAQPVFVQTIRGVGYAFAER